MNKNLFKINNVGAFLCVVSASLICNVIVCFIKIGFNIIWLNVSMIFVPIIVAILATIFLKSNFIRNENNLIADFLIKVRYGTFLAVFLFLISEYFGLIIQDYKILVAILFFSLLGTLLSFILVKYGTESKIKADGKVENKDVKNNLFSTYYINLPKVFEISMLINNKIMTAIENEKTTEHNDLIEEKFKANVKIDYLNSIKTSMDFDKSNSKSNSEKNKVVESFDVKTTKSNLLDIIINECDEYSSQKIIRSGDLIVFRNVTIKLKNQQETMQIMKMLLGGAFNGSVLSGEAEGFNMQLNMSSLINSFLKDCSYELECKIGDFVFEVKIPMSFENDFENSYNIYDLLAGEMTIVGIYKGEHIMQEVKSVYELLNTASSQSTSVVETKMPSKLKKSANDDTIYKDANETRTSKNEGKQKFVDVIAIIQYINLNESSEDNEKITCIP